MNFLIIGYGGMGAYHEQCLKKYGLGKVTGVYDIDKSRLEAARDCGLRTFNTESEIYDNLELFDAVIVATPNDVHSYYCKKLAQLNKHIICEKPAAITPEEFEKMFKIAQTSGVNLEVHQNRRWDSDFLTARAIESDGYLGKIYRVESRVMGANGIPGGWRKHREKGGGMMLDWGVHLIDQACFWFGYDIKSIYARYSYNLGFEVDDGFILTLEFKSGLIYEITVETNSLIQLPRWVIYGIDGTAEITDWDLNGEIAIKKDSLEKLVGIKAGNGFTKTMAKRPLSAVEYFDLPKQISIGSEFYVDFIDACTKGISPKVKSDEVLKVLKIMQLAEKSAKENRVIFWEE